MNSTSTSLASMLEILYLWASNQERILLNKIPHPIHKSIISFDFCFIIKSMKKSISVLSASQTNFGYISFSQLTNLKSENSSMGLLIYGRVLIKFMLGIWNKNYLIFFELFFFRAEIFAWCQLNKTGGTFIQQTFSGLVYCGYSRFFILFSTE